MQQQYTDKVKLLEENAQVKQLQQFAQSKFGGLWRFLFFCAGCCVVLAGTMNIMVGLGEFISPFDMIAQFYLVGFGLVMVIIDTPYENERIRQFKLSIFKYLLFMTRFVGRGIWYMFLSTMVWCSTYGLDLEPFIGFILTAYVFCIGVLSVYTGLVKSVKLEKLRKEVIKQGPERVNSMAPSSGFHYGSFNEFSLQMTNHMTPKVQFTEEEYGYIAGALSFKVNTDGVIDPAEFRSWTIGSMTIL